MTKHSMMPNATHTVIILDVVPEENCETGKELFDGEVSVGPNDEDC
jgi:hypothetical protein